MKCSILIGLLFSFTLVANSQVTVPLENLPSHSDTLMNFLTKEYGRNKTIPAQYREQVLLALSHFPELKDTKIEWRIKHQYTPLTTKPDFWSMFKQKNKRGYIITISDKTIDTLTRLLYQNLTFEEQVGIMGHELSHVVDFRSKNLLQSAQSAIGHLSRHYIDRMEYHTVMICVQHGLGNELQAYSQHVRDIMHVHNWRGVDFVFDNNEQHERYMNPETIEKYKKETGTPDR
jgi:hypothetical protein